MDHLIEPHGEKEQLMPLCLEGKDCKNEIKKANSLRKMRITSRETCDIIMMGIGAFSPLAGFMNKLDWEGVCDDFTMSDGTFWPIPITLSTDDEVIREGDEISLVDDESNTIVATMRISEKYCIDKVHECQRIYYTTDQQHPGVAKVISQGKYNLGGPVKVVSEGLYPDQFKGIYQTPMEAREIFNRFGWKRVSAMQLRNPMHRSHEYLAKIALEISDGIYIHQPLGKLKDGDIPANVRVKAVQAVLDNYFAKGTTIQGGYPMEMRYAGPREALLHAIIRQNYGCSNLVIGRDHAGVGSYYGPFDSQRIFDEIPRGALKCKNLNIDVSFYCYKCGTMASVKTCPHGKENHLILSGTKVREILSRGGKLPPEFSRPEVVEILEQYYKGIS